MEEKKKAKKEPKKKAKREEVCTTFKVSDGKKEILTRSCGQMEKKHASEKEVRRFSKLLFNTLAFLVFLFILFFSIYHISTSSKMVYFKEVEYRRVHEGESSIYRAYIPLASDLGGATKYGVSLHNDPRKLSRKVPLEGGDVSLKQYVVVGYYAGDRTCEENLLAARKKFNEILSEGIGLTLVETDVAFCGSGTESIYISVEAGDKTRIEKIGESCYILEFADCEVLEVTERFLLEAISEYSAKVK